MKLEYLQLIFSYKENAIHTETLNEVGKESWELVTSTKIDEHNICYTFKRELIYAKQKQLLNEGAQND